MTDCGPLSTIFPRDQVGSLSNPGLVAVQSLPSVLTLVVWLYFECSSKLRRASSATLVLGNVVSIAGIATMPLLTWRVFDILECEGVDEAEGWRMLVVLAAPLLGVCTLIVGRRFPRIAALSSVSFSASSVFVDWFLREEIDTSSASQPLPSFQLAWCAITIACVSRIAPRRKYVLKEKKTPFSSIAMIDPTYDVKPPASNVPSDRHSSWFS